MKKILTFLCMVPFFINAQQTLFESISHDSVIREYIVYLPAIYDGSYDAPILFVFHGYGGNNYGFMNNKVDFRPIADTSGFIIVYPQGSKLNGTTHWNVGSWTASSTVDDVGFVEAIIDTLTTNYNINESRIYACGNSNGGYFSFELGCKLSNRIAAIGSNSGTMSLETYDACNPLHPTAVLSIHGTADNTVSYNGDKPFNSISLMDVNNYWINFNNTDTLPIVTKLPDINTTDGSTVELQEYENGNNCTSVVHYKIIGGGHSWPGFRGNMDIDARKVIWDFVSRYDINGLIGCGPITNNEHIQKTNFTKFAPNPTKDFVIIETNLTRSLDYHIYSITGKHIITGKIEASKKSIDLTDLPTGIYMLKINNRTAKLIKTE